MQQVVRVPGLVGRTAELAVVSRALTDARQGRGTTLLVLGEAGIGKSRLLRESSARARDAGLVVLTGRAVEGGGAYRPIAAALLAHLRDARLSDAAELRPYRSALSRLVPGLSDEPMPEAAVDPALVLGEGVLRLLRAIGAEHGCLLALEDLHWADADTVALVDYLAETVASSPVVVVASAREDEPSAASANAFQRLAGHATTLRLGRLSSADVGALAAAMSGGAPVSPERHRELVERSDGLPYLVAELLDHDGRLPPSLAALVAARLDRLSPAHRALLEAAAVIGTDPDWTLLARVAGLDEAAVLAALRAATAAQLLVAEDSQLRWRHALTREAVLATLLPPERAALARRAAEVVLARAGAEDDALAADLLTDAGDLTRAAETLLRLARHDLRHGAVRSAEERLRRAEATGSLRSTQAVDHVRLLTQLGHPSEALQVGARALSALVGDQHADLCLELARTAVIAVRYPEAEAYVDRAGRDDDPRSLVHRADIAFGLGDPDRAARLAGRAVEAAEAAGQADTLCAALLVIGRCTARTDPAAAGPVFRRAAATAAEHALVSERIEALIGLGSLELVDHAAAPSWVAARELALDAGMLTQAAQTGMLVASTIAEAAGPRAAEELTRQCVAEARRLREPSLVVATEALLAQCRACVGDVAAAAELAAAVERRGADAPAGDWVTMAAVIRAHSALWEHDLALADRLLDGPATEFARHASAPPLSYWGLWALLRTVVGPDGSAARATVRRLPAAIRATNRGALAYADAVVAGRSGRPDQAVRLFDEGDRLLAEASWLRRLLRLLTLEAAVRDGWGDPVPHLRHDLAAYEAAGDTGFARTARDLLREAGAPTGPPRTRTPVPARLRALGVTGREMDVLTMVAGGLTNAQVAERLFLSTRTVEAHVASLLTKTGARGRGELRAWL